MPSFGTRSRKRLSTCDERLIRLAEAVVKHFDCTVLTGSRNEEEQEEKVRQGLSKVHWPDSKHNEDPSKAIDLAPYPIDWEDIDRFRYFGGFVMGMAAAMGIKIRWGGDWDGDTQTKDNRFNDLPHFELID